MIELVAVFAWGVVAACVTAAALRKRSTLTRAVVSVLAACVAIGTIIDVRRPYGLAPVRTSEDHTWSQVRQSYVKAVPAFADMLKLSPVIESEFKAAILPVFRNRDIKRVAVDDAVAAAAFNRVLDKHVMPAAAHGSPAAVNAWGGITAPMLQQLAVLSTEACAEYAMTRVARYANHARISALGETGYRAIIDAYKTSDSAKYPLPDRETFINQYVKVIRTAQPPFTNEELQAFLDLGKEPPDRQCNLTLRLYQAIDRLDPTGKALIYRYLMRRPD